LTESWLLATSCMSNWEKRENLVGAAALRSKQFVKSGHTRNVMIKCCHVYT
jgi:hypothetical protein